MVISGLGPGALGTKLVPGTARYATWCAGTFHRHVKVHFSWSHSHNQWTEAVRWYVNASAAQLSLGGGGALGSPGWLHRDGAAELLPHLDRSGVAPTCLWSRDQAPRDVIDGTAEKGNQFYRLSSGCKPFETAPGMPYVFVAVTSPASPDVEVPLAGLHLVTRMFLEAPSITSRPTFWPSEGWLDYGDVYSSQGLDVFNRQIERPADAPEWPQNATAPNELQQLCNGDSPFFMKNICLWRAHTY